MTELDRLIQELEENQQMIDKFIFNPDWPKLMRLSKEGERNDSRQDK